ncbi:MAG: hypothetical protein UT51_C0014G0008 [Candidatus Nomurabacteria bacterium GW2011_GWC2_39_41]|uniref:Uncharacterized protein n=2 Tax=Candidatus Nomuraibacteriota TaxID=1752729 RepID=A0A837HUX7_9BACT|nr:MAG: hypothetical protein UT27_C0017G0003 [Candidatus Nomurabacteria bacterium GW2011_GWD2_39_12]KKR19869.1 MAG: hypothetical protein UT51_C0014G0008 [Candidatus Nomurabacteria bacterium GW2011_GWC2_39_41]KKR36315.1 MAG: hypothetical protein UT70_C0016G0008 [Candidatus Nomurabacteria bacterium GW2011_GWE2_40_10]KKR37947.1 MAG: hypothetical protein UT73_C0010G0008 [Candidatus Nomurabacteria bacterium GW2011_GWB1_40_11]KKR66076.1 MAG: hypothetical protein UU07_C0019G0005 [Parcubacteria group b
MKTVLELRRDIEYWTKILKEAEQKLRERSRELSEAVRYEEEQRNKKAA